MGLLFTIGALLPRAAECQSTVLIEMETDHGTIMAEVDTVRAPVTATNFLEYVDMGMYSGGTFYRTVRADNQPDNDVKIGVIQGGIARDRRDDQLPPIRLEPTGETGILHLDGVLSMARAGPDTGQGEFFICVGPQPELDQGGRRNPDRFGFAAFGRVVGGMDVVRSIQSKEADGQYFAEGERVRILGIRRVS
jgi:peptidyl-prolyl cis-trans isomerase A (cyclophilin A)